jgi:hypothetical protein
MQGVTSLPAFIEEISILTVETCLPREDNVPPQARM